MEILKYAIIAILCLIVLNFALKSCGRKSVEVATGYALVDGMQKILNKFDNLDLSELSSGEKESLQESLKGLDAQVKTGVKVKMLKGRILAVMGFFNTINRDEKISHEEYDDWMKFYESRDSIDEESLRQYFQKYSQPKQQTRKPEVVETGL